MWALIIDALPAKIPEMIKIIPEGGIQGWIEEIRDEEYGAPVRHEADLRPMNVPLGD